MRIVVGKLANGTGARQFGLFILQEKFPLGTKTGRFCIFFCTEQGKYPELRPGNGLADIFYMNKADFRKIFIKYSMNNMIEHSILFKSAYNNVEYYNKKILLLV